MSTWGVPQPGNPPPLVERLHRAWHRENLDAPIDKRGLMLEHSPHHVTSADITELLHCLHDDIRATHFAFRHVDALRKEITVLKVLHKKEQCAAENREKARAIAQTKLLETLSEATASVRERSEGVVALIESVKTLTAVISQMDNDLLNLDARVKTIETRRWWRKLFGDLKEAMWPFRALRG